MSILSDVSRERYRGRDCHQNSSLPLLIGRCTEVARTNLSKYGCDELRANVVHYDDYDGYGAGATYNTVPTRTISSLRFLSPYNETGHLKCMIQETKGSGADPPC
jgi:hypothetical protein